MAKANAARATIRVQLQDRRALSRVLWPSAMTGFSGTEAHQRLRALPGTLGAVRDGYGAELIWASSREEFMDRARGIYSGVLRPFAERGALVVAGIAGTPRWLADDPSDSAPVPGSGWPAYATRPPTDPDAYAQLARDLVRMANDARVVIEFWNEPGATCFWNGPRAALYDLFDRVSAAVRAEGGQIIGMANSPPWDGWLEDWIKTARPVTSGISWHLYHRQPLEGMHAAELVRSWLSEAGLRADLPQVVTEWNRWNTWPEELEPARDTAVGMAHHMAALDAFARSGVLATTVCNLAGFRQSEIGAGDFGLLARGADGVLREKRTWEVQRALAQLGTQQLGVTVAPALLNLGVGTIAAESTQCGVSVTAILWRYDENPDAVPVPIDISWPGLHRRIELAPYDLQVVSR